MAIEIDNNIADNGKIVIKNLDGYTLHSHEVRTTTADQINVIIQLHVQKES